MHCLTGLLYHLGFPEIPLDLQNDSPALGWNSSSFFLKLRFPSRLKGAPLNRPCPRDPKQTALRYETGAHDLQNFMTWQDNKFTRPIRHSQHLLTVLLWSSSPSDFEANHWRNPLVHQLSSLFPAAVPGEKFQCIANHWIRANLRHMDKWSQASHCHSPSHRLIWYSNKQSISIYELLLWNR